ncbi:glycerophosphodiester phosphodiesterase family protein [Parapedobacter sp. ISTM3]|uniref:glycerophosphodiester phosphodiesterase family protein n=1 Tax=Parapedobacter sp. ISTM3 TaxID=2800130 RepID=UPI001903650E|nr:glycerophosphodiester phosphodiesterase family protein [Parapedobacter sp. ISTM3]MBK1441954.1 glycerophosphodiester phosphodiesterase family protein [Parapedobacter sp. ISTM3]
MIRRSTSLLTVAVISLFITSCLPSNLGSSDFRYAANKIKLTSVSDLYRFFTYNEKRYPLVSAHRGGPAPGFPENAIETFENSYRHQPIIIEFDVRLTKDSVLVLMHDETLDRTTSGTGKLSEITFAALRKLRLKDSEGNLTAYRIPTLDEALQWGAGKVVFTIDVKRDVPYAAVIEAIRRNSAQAYSVVITYNADQAAAVHQLAPDLMISASIRSADDLLRLSDRNIPDNRLLAFVGTSEAPTSVYELLHGHGIPCILGTMGNLDKRAATRGDTVYTGLVERGADILSTDRPIEAGRALHAYRNAHKLTSPFVN